MKRIILLLLAVSTTGFIGCAGPEGPRGETGYSAEAIVYETVPINFLAPSYGVFYTFPQAALNSDHVLVYRLSGVDNGEDVWQALPYYKYFPNGTLDFGFDFDATRFDINIVLRGTGDLQTLNDNIRLGQIFRVVIIPGQFANKGVKNTLDLNDYNAVIKAYNIDDRNIKKIK
ncbi:MAG: hypothetical protein IPP30_06235 [Flavobacterium sp.]|nr:hypothetical protein [Flavobacterium sp.]